ncbi:replication-associated protein [Finch associated genomovirus 9]|nr:replication-associated protein [Finch associated genomovirus 9]
MVRTVNWSVAIDSIAFLTYSQFNGDPIQRVSDIQACLACLGVHRCIVGHELHQDGGHHYHVVAQWETVFKAHDIRVFDVDGCHPNFKSVRGDGNVNRVLDYCLKDDDYYGDDPEFFRRAAPVRSKTSIWAEIVGAQSASEFWRLARELAPFEFVNNHSRLQHYVDTHYDIPGAYVSEHANFVVPDVMNQWFQENVVSSSAAPEPGRPRSLCLIGESGLGKTEWARSLGSHFYMNLLFNLDEYLAVKDTALYGVLDDIDIEYFPNYKGWFGGQKEFTGTDKFRKKVRIMWRRPIIWCSNDDPRQAKNVDVSWMNTNCVFVSLYERLY